MNLLVALKSVHHGEALDALSRSLVLSHKQTAMGVNCSASTLALALILRMEKGDGMPAVDLTAGQDASARWVGALLGGRYPAVLNAIAAFSQTTPEQAAKCLAFAAETLQQLLEGRIYPGQEDVFIREIYPQKEALMSTLPANVVAALDLAYLQAGLARDFGRGALKHSRRLFRLVFLLLAVALFLWCLLRIYRPGLPLF